MQKALIDHNAGAVVSRVVSPGQEIPVAGPLHEWLDAGDEVVEGMYYRDGDFATAEALALQPSVEELAITKRRAIHAEARRRRDALIPTYPEHERETWTQQAEEALAYQADPAAETPLLSAMVAARGITLADLVAKVIAKRAAFADGGGHIIGAQQALEDQLETALATYDTDGDEAAARASIQAIDETDPANWPT